MNRLVVPLALGLAAIGCNAPPPSADSGIDVVHGIDATDAPDVSTSPPGPDGGGDALVLGPPRTNLAAVHVDGTRFRDGMQRELLFRGYNLKISGLFDVTFSDGRTANEVITPFNGWQDFEDLGWNVIRLPVNWSGFEPYPMQYSQSFLTLLDQVLATAWAHGIYVIIDFHQDAYSKEIGEDGEPLWAIVPPPLTLLSGPSNDSRRTTTEVLSAGFNFFRDVPATDGRLLQAAYVTAAQLIAQHTLGNPAVLGFEAFNEPVVFDQDELNTFHQRFADGIHAIDRDAPVLFEPFGSRNQTDMAFISPTPWANGPGAYAPHIYTGWFSFPSQDGWASEDPSVIVASVTGAQNEAAAWGTPLFVTEYGCDVTDAHGVLWMSTVLDNEDRVLASSTAWERGPGDWGLYDGTQLRLNLTPTVGRSFPRATAGDLIAIERPALGALHVRYMPNAASAGLPHEVSASGYSITNVTASCNGVPVTYTRQSGHIEFVCTNNPPTGEAYYDVVGTPVPSVYPGDASTADGDAADDATLPDSADSGDGIAG